MDLPCPGASCPCVRTSPKRVPPDLLPFGSPSRGRHEAQDGPLPWRLLAPSLMGPNRFQWGSLWLLGAVPCLVSRLTPYGSTGAEGGVTDGLPSRLSLP